MKPSMPFLIGGMTCQTALNSLELLLRNALVERSGFLHTFEGITKQMQDDNALEQRIRNIENEVLLIEELLDLIPKAKGGTDPKHYRREIVRILREQEQAIIEKAEPYVNRFRGRLELLTADIEFFKLLSRVIEADA